ncbi:hypothetical protein CCP4SC76_1390011 [Gammaproteobacteria bacterium]
MSGQCSFSVKITTSISHGFDPGYKPSKKEISLPDIVLQPRGSFRRKLQNGMTVSVTYQKVAKGYGNVPGHDDLQVKRTPSVQRNPRTEGQVQQRDRFRTAISAWHALPTVEKTTWDQKARPKKRKHPVNPVHVRFLTILALQKYFVVIACRAQCRTMCRMDIPIASNPFTDFLVAQNAFYTQIIESLIDENRLLNEKIQYLLNQRFGSKSERFDPNQLSLFDELPLPEGFTPTKLSVAVAAHVRQPGGRRSLPAHLPRVEVVIDLSEDEKQCSCGLCKDRIDEERSERLGMQPAKFWVEVLIRPTYACSRCHAAPVTAPLPPAALPRTQTSPSLLANIGTSKFVDGLPLHRQARILEQRFGIPFTTTTLADWMIKSATGVLKPLVQAMLPILHASDYWHMDETRVQVLHEEERTPHQLSWFWLRRTAWGIPVVLFDYSPSRSGKTAIQLLEGFSGYLQSDGLASYDVASGPKVKQLGCWSHVRRKFKDAIKGAGKDNPPPLAIEALEKIRQLYKIDNEVKDKTPEERYAHRQLYSKPLLDEIQLWLQTNMAAGLARGGALAKAFTYLHNQWPKLIRFLEDGRLKLDNNAAENCMRPIATGRKNWLFCNSEAGAHATAIWYSVVETAKANGWEPYHYLIEIFTQVPVYLQQGRPLDDLLPWNLKPPNTS